jgi:hypothetical protein
MIPKLKTFLIVIETTKNQIYGTLDAKNTSKSKPYAPLQSTEKKDYLTLIKQAFGK